MIVDPIYNKITNVRIKRMPNRNHKCPCGKGQVYKKCCEGRDLVKKNEMLGEIEWYFIGEVTYKPQKTAGTSQLLFV